MDRYYIPPSEDEVTNAFIQASSVIKENDGVKTIILLTPVRNDIENGVVDTFLGSVTEELIKNKSFTFKDGIIIKHETNQTFSPPKAVNAVIIGLYAGEKMLNKIDDSKAAIAAIIAPSIEDRYTDDWVKTWNPKIFGKETKSEKSGKLISNPVVENALKSLTNRFRRSDRVYISGKLDKEAAVQVFYILYQNREHYDPASIRQWAVRNGWTSKSADELKEISQAILNGKRIRRGEYLHWKQDIIENWRED